MPRIHDSKLGTYYIIQVRRCARNWDLYGSTINMLLHALPQHCVHDKLKMRGCSIHTELHSIALVYTAFSDDTRVRHRIRCDRNIVKPRLYVQRGQVGHACQLLNGFLTLRNSVGWGLNSSIRCDGVNAYPIVLPTLSLRYHDHRG